jgi:DNA-directed RNA polymerase specialized sigma24 family protein
MAALLKKGIGELPERERKVLALYHFQEMTMKETGAALGIGESRVSQIHTAVLSRLRVRLRDMLERKAASANDDVATAAARPHEAKRRYALASAAHA